MIFLTTISHQFLKNCNPKLFVPKIWPKKNMAIIGFKLKRFFDTLVESMSIKYFFFEKKNKKYINFEVQKILKKSALEMSSLRDLIKFVKRD